MVVDRLLRPIYQCWATLASLLVAPPPSLSSPPLTLDTRSRFTLFGAFRRVVRRTLLNHCCHSLPLLLTSLRWVPVQPVGQLSPASCPSRSSSCLADGTSATFQTRSSLFTFHVSPPLQCSRFLSSLCLPKRSATVRIGRMRSCFVCCWLFICHICATDGSHGLLGPHPSLS